MSLYRSITCYSAGITVTFTPVAAEVLRSRLLMNIIT